MDTEEKYIAYKVWVDIERFDEATGEGEELDAPGSSLAAFGTFEEAWDYAEHIVRLAEADQSVTLGPSFSQPV